jgi:hypothetical protein
MLVIPFEITLYCLIPLNYHWFLSMSSGKFVIETSVLLTHQGAYASIWLLLQWVTYAVMSNFGLATTDIKLARTKGTELTVD